MSFIAKKQVNNFKFNAFTLAEVLIVIGIIGIIAEITIPTLVSNIQDLQFKSAAKEAFSKASQAVQLMKQDVGGNFNAYRSVSSSFKPDFIKYFKVVKDCGNWDECVTASNPSPDYSTLSGDGAQTWHMSSGQFITADGMLYGIGNLGDGNLLITVDVNGNLKKPNMFGRDTFVFQINSSDILVPMGAVNTLFPTSGNYCVKSSVMGPDSDQGCMSYVMQGVNYP